jgi:hypothetical protein
MDNPSGTRKGSVAYIGMPDAADLFNLTCYGSSNADALTTRWPSEPRHDSPNGFYPASVNLDLVKQYHTATDCRSQMNGTEQQLFRHFSAILLFYSLAVR